MDEKIKMAALAKLDELKAILEPAGMDLDDFVEQFGGEDEGEEEGEGPMPMDHGAMMDKGPMGAPAGKDPAKIALIVARLKKKGA